MNRIVLSVQCEVCVNCQSVCEVCQSVCKVCQSVCGELCQSM